MLKSFIFRVSALLILTACSGSGSSGGRGVRVLANPCLGTTVYPNAVTITGKGVYQFRTNGNGAVSGTTPPIRKANVAVYNSAGLPLQCGSTDDNGDFSLNVPSGSDYTVRISSIIYDSVTKAAVYNNPTQNRLHVLSSSNFSASSSTNIGTLTASATGDVLGGGFNILDKIYGANIYLLQKTNNCSATFSSCSPVTNVPNVFIFWDKGVNPGSYFGAGPVSFYLPGESELYILGGETGDVDDSDTDHFDDSVILHEYGHFIEDIFAKTDSPGGWHNGDYIIDPRLAWGEGWANFFQAAVLDVPIYRDTSGNTDPGNTHSELFNEDLETPDNDIPAIMGEGNFREFSITRMLWDVIDVANEGHNIDEVTAPFSELWTLFTSSTHGFKKDLRFRHVGLFHALQVNLPGRTDWSSVRASEKQTIGEDDYANPAAVGSCSPITIEAENISPSDPEVGTAATSNQFASNDFYRIFHVGGALQILLNHSSSTSPSADLDLYLYKEKYRFGITADMVGRSTTFIPGTTLSGSENINAFLAAGWYMLNVRVNTSQRNGQPATYTLKLNGANLCPH